MGLTTALIAVALIIIGLPITLAVAGGSIDGLIQSAEDKKDAIQFGNNPVAGDRVCDLVIHTEGQLDFNRSNFLAPLGSNLEVYMGNQGDYPQVVDATWSNCRTDGSFSFASFFGGIQALALVTEDSFELEMIGKSNTSGKPLTENSDTKVWNNNVKFADAVFAGLSSTDLPAGWQTDYYLTNVKADSYTLSFFAVGGSINEQGVNKAFTYHLSAP